LSPAVFSLFLATVSWLGTTLCTFPCFCLPGPHFFHEFFVFFPTVLGRSFFSFRVSLKRRLRIARFSFPLCSVNWTPLHPTKQTPKTKRTPLFFLPFFFYGAPTNKTSGIVLFLKENLSGSPWFTLFSPSFPQSMFPRPQPSPCGKCLLHRTSLQSRPPRTVFQSSKWPTLCRWHAGFFFPPQSFFF